MKVIVADKISERGVKLLKEQAGWNVVLTTKDNLNAEIADAEALIVRSFLAGHFKKKKELRRRWHAVLAEMDRIEELLSEA